MQLRFNNITTIKTSLFEFVFILHLQICIKSHFTTNYSLVAHVIWFSRISDVVFIFANFVDIFVFRHDAMGINRIVTIQKNSNSRRLSFA